VRALMALTLLLISNAVSAEAWVTLRRPPEPGESVPAGILVDTASIEILATGIRLARIKLDSGRRRDMDKSAPNIISFMIFVNSYDCEKQMTHHESLEAHHTDGSVHHIDVSKNPTWYPAPSNRAADLTVDFVCGWKPK
jgi:hypothetical protein